MNIGVAAPVRLAQRLPYFQVFCADDDSDDGILGAWVLLPSALMSVKQHGAPGNVPAMADYVARRGRAIGLRRAPLAGPAR